ncbi:MAG: hypothetical protein DCF26_20175 [Burkholderiales bacterium]|nr:MAG: hypothetical protein DCF26_20175 [Burkholderiales bacterium]
MTRPEKDEHRPAESSPGEGPYAGDQHRRRKGRWLLLLMVLVFLAMAAFTARWWQFSHRSNALTAAYKASQPYPGFAIGELGGMPVKLPRHLAELLEYDGDPGWAPAPDWLPPVRTFDSKISSFGFYLRFPDGATLDSWERREEKRLTPPWEDRWISAGVASSKHYPGHGFLHRYMQSILKNRDHTSALFRYHPQTLKEFGLEVYKLASPPEGPDPMKLIIHEEYFGRDATDRLVTNIRCTVIRADINRSTCSQVWSLEDRDLRIQLTAQYRRPLLEHWREIQPMVTQIVLGFRHDPSQPEATPFAPR